MQERKQRLDVRISKKEKDMIRNKARKAGISQSTLVRQAIDKAVLNPAANEDVMVLLREIRIVKRQLSEILAKTEARNAIDFVQANRAIRSAEVAIDRINRAYTPGG
ncbi:MAG: ribbon-helix-helix protein, CopG family [Oscillospiraceae bacterium]|nr:ribbon-helix-helix protein, CopG family [Oscillospiraceae bacterium]